LVKVISAFHLNFLFVRDLQEGPRRSRIYVIDIKTNGEL